MFDVSADLTHHCTSARVVIIVGASVHTSSVSSWHRCNNQIAICNEDILWPRGVALQLVVAAA